MCEVGVEDVLRNQHDGGAPEEHEKEDRAEPSQLRPILVLLLVVQLDGETKLVALGQVYAHSRLAITFI